MKKSTMRYLTDRDKKLKSYGRVTNKNKKKVTSFINSKIKEMGYDDELSHISSKASIKEVEQAKKKLIERIGYDILVEGINEGYWIVTEKYSKELKKAKDKDVQKLAKYGTEFSKIKAEQKIKLSDKEREYLENGNNNILGFGNRDFVTEIENAGNIRTIKKLLEQSKNLENPNEEFYQKNEVIIDRVFQKIGIVREDDINRIKEELRKKSIMLAGFEIKNLLGSIDMYGSDQFVAGSYNGNETDLANARLDDMLIRLGIVKGTKPRKKKIEKIYKQNISRRSREYRKYQSQFRTSLKGKKKR